MINESTERGEMMSDLSSFLDVGEIIREGLAHFEEKRKIFEERREEFLRDHPGECVVIHGPQNNIRFGRDLAVMLDELPVEERRYSFCELL